MHGLINRSLECFLSDTYGNDVWHDVVNGANLGIDKFESMLEYDDSLTYAVLDAAADRLSKSQATLLEDLGTYLVSHPRVESLRRLLRFGGGSFIEFLHSLDDLQDRAKLALPELKLPRLTLIDCENAGQYKLSCRGPYKGFGRVMLGLLRAMADDYGALVVLEDQESDQGNEDISITLVESEFSDGRAFSLAGPIGAQI